MVAALLPRMSTRRWRRRTPATNAATSRGSDTSQDTAFHEAARGKVFLRPPECVVVPRADGDVAPGVEQAFGEQKAQSS